MPPVLPHCFSVEDSRRRLPHRYPPGKWLFMTWHLHGSLPHGMYPPPRKCSAGAAFTWLDRRLDTPRTGPLYLAQETVAEAVRATLLKGVRLRYFELGAWAILPNHVHLLLLPTIDPSRLLKSLKGASARQANRLLGRTGEGFWQAESYDHWVRNDEEWRRIAAYIEENPVRAGLAARASDYPWSSAGSNRRDVNPNVNAADTNVCATRLRDSCRYGGQARDARSLTVAALKRTRTSTRMSTQT